MGKTNFYNMEENIMALGQQTNRTVGGLEFDVATLTGIIATHAAFVDTLDTATDDTYVDLASTSDGSGVGATFTVVISGNAVDTVTMTAPGTGYAVGDTLVIDFSLITGASSGTVASTVATVVGEVATVTVTDGGTNWVTGDVVSAGELTTDGGGSGLAGTVTASALNGDTPETGGVISAVTVTAGGTGYAVGDSQVYSGTEIGPADARYIDHDQYELGGIQTEYVTDKSSYTPTVLAEDMVDGGTLVGDPARAKEVGQRFDDNASTTKVVLKADLPQWSVQQRDIDGGAITVFAEPNVVDRNGKRIGHTVRAEDCVDEARCTALGFTWINNAPTGDADQGDYGYCQNPAGTAHADAATVNALDPVTYDRQFECTNAGFHWEASETDPDERCKDTDTAGDFSFGSFVDSLTGNNFATTSTAQQYAETVCKQYGYYWEKATMTCKVYVDPATLITKATCLADGHVWIAGACYDGADFGDGQSRTAQGAQDPTVAPK